ncbi:MAG: enoyl-[acyl-carrier-protein] reductase FabI [Candidatus Cloacimonetes bacterium HGW-Cloacimonetes-1]|jgi:enoyl-[acyl-carrier protein] reductase I|nr:MAG: enoyl-[acyl-carrier-protein] reductase FabI [Candidatus Cloacimonetes bacterium HGW-Cloacimonetes-1]
MNLAGKNVLIYGIANSHSIAYGIAKELQNQGCNIGLSYASQALIKRVLPIAEEVGAKFCLECDVSKDYEIRELYSQIAKQWDKIDIIVHSIAYAPKDELNLDFHNTSRHGFIVAMDISVYSLIAVVREAMPYLSPDASILTLTYYGSQKVAPNYGVMGVAKAALESAVRYLAYSLGEHGIRINALSAGPIRTLSSSAVSGLSQLQKRIEKTAPLARNITLEDIAKSAVYLVSDLSSGVTGETLYVDAGINIMAY